MSFPAALVVIYLDFTGRLLAVLATPAGLIIAAIFILALLLALSVFIQNLRLEAPSLDKVP